MAPQHFGHSSSTQARITQPVIKRQFTSNVAHRQFASSQNYSQRQNRVVATPPSAVEARHSTPNKSTPPKRVRRPISLREAIQRALSRSDVVRTLNGRVNVETTTGFDPLIAQTDWRSRWADFDPRVSAEFEGSQVDKPPSSFFGPGIELQTRRDEGNLSLSLDKRWTPGTTTRVAYDPSLGYLFFPQGTFDPDEFNPSYSSDIVFEVRQPLLRGRGSFVNLAPIQIAQTRIEQSKWEVQELTISEVRSVEEAYWNLQAARLIRKSIEEVIPLDEEAVRVEELRYQSERNIYADVARAKTNLESFLQQRFRANRTVQTREYQLRQLIGLPVDDGTELIPDDDPKQEFTSFNHEVLVTTALQHRPDLIQRRLRVRAEEVQLEAQRNSLYPQLDVFANYRTSGLASRLDHSLRQMSQIKYTDWTLGAAFSVPLGNRRAQAETEAEELRLSKERVLLTEFESQVSFQLAKLIYDIEMTWRRFQSAMRQSKYTEQWLKLSRIRYASPPPGNANQDWLLLALYDYQQAMQSHIDAITEAAELLASYNTQLARLDEEQGILLDRRHVEFANAAPPINTQVQPAPTRLPSIPQPTVTSPAGSAVRIPKTYGHTSGTTHTSQAPRRVLKPTGPTLQAPPKQPRAVPHTQPPITQTSYQYQPRSAVRGIGHSAVRLQEISPIDSESRKIGMPRRR